MEGTQHAGKSMCHVARDAGGARVLAQWKPRVVTNAKRGPQLTLNGALFKCGHSILPSTFLTFSMHFSAIFVQ